MARQRLCILCETVHTSQQEMREHMRSMLHHRELEKLKGRDCGHECRVCKVTVVSLTDYASHISSPVHKQNVEAEQQNAGNNHDDCSFDKELVELVEKRKEQIRKEKEAAAAAAAKLAKEEAERRRKEEFQQRLKEAKDHYQMDYAWKQQSQRFGGSGQHNPWYEGNRYNGRSGKQWPFYKPSQGKCATWHAQEPPNFQKWAGEGFVGGNMHIQGGWNDRQWAEDGPFGNQQCRFPWISSGGSRNGLYGHNNIPQYKERGRPLSFTGPSTTYPPPLNQFQNTANEQGGHQGCRLLEGGGHPTERDHNKSSKNFGSNSKLDKSCRWSPYPVTKGSESGPHKDTKAKSSEKKNPKVSKTQKQGKAPETTSAFNSSQPEQKPGSSNQSSRSSSAQREDSGSAPPSKTVNKQLLHKDKKISSASLSFRDQLSKAFSAELAQSKQTAKQSGLSSEAPKRKKKREGPRKRKEKFLEKKGSFEGAMNNQMKMLQQNEEEQQRPHALSLMGVNKENSCGQNATIPKNQTDSVKPQQADLQSSDSSQFLQSLQVSTSTAESSEPAASKQGDENTKKSEKPSCSVSTEEAMQTVEAGQGSEGDTSKGGEAQSSLSNTSLSKLDLQSVLRRDLTKHISLKNKTGSHEPNLNIARRVRNLSESRRSDTEKESGLKPTVRQLISASGSRRNVNWDQVYQEVRKKQDKGKGMPRFGIEMVPNEQEDQSQEECDIPLLEGFQWDSLMDFSPPVATRKRSLSESSLAPESTPAIFTSLMSKELAQKESKCSSQDQGFSVPPIFTSDNKEVHHQQGMDHLLAQSEIKVEKQPEQLSSAIAAKTLQRSDSALGDSSSGAEQIDGQGTGKRRRAAGDAPATETSCLEHNNKRQKVKTKDRLQIDQLLSVSLREEELSRSLQTVDTSLIQARAALEAAYMEVQRLMVVKQQMTVEMSTLRNKRIELLKGMQGSLQEEPQVKLKEEKMDFFDPNILSPAAAATPLSPSRPSHCASPPSSPPLMSVVIKQEPQSPLFVSSELDPEYNVTHCAHSTTPELPAAPATPPPDPALDFQPSSGRNAELCQTNRDCKESLSGLVETTEKASQATSHCLTPMSDSKTPIKLLAASRRSSEVGSVVDCASTKFFEPPSVPASPPDQSNGKRVRKLKKRKSLKKAQGTEQPESSDTELDREPQRPRWLRTRRRPSGGSQVTTSSSHVEDREGDMSVEKREVPCRHLFPIVRLEPIDNHASKHRSTLINLDSEENMEVTAVYQQQHADALVPAPAPVHSPKPGLQSLACNEVTSTSDIDICKSTESDMRFSNTLPETIKISSDVSSDHSVDAMPTEGAFEGHQEAVNAMQIHGGLLYTCSGDRTVRVFDLVSHKCVGVFEGHSSKVSCLLVSAAPCLHHRLYSGSSDQTIRCYSLKTQEFEQQFSVSDRVLCLHSRWNTLYAGLANGTVVTFNLKTNKQMDVFECHGPRAVSCLASSQEGARRILLVGSYDKTISVRDAKSGLLLRTLKGHTKTVLCMKVVNDLVFSGSSDQCVHAHNIHTGELVRVYKDHSHAVTVVNVLGKVMVTACLDKLVRVFDLQTHEQLQVYGGHEDMLMCMAVHKNMIYTGCYDGSVQAIKLNLMQSYRCWWYGCSLRFGVMDHLKQHLIKDHTSANIQTLKCHWKNCEELLSMRSSNKEGVLLHMRKHAEEETDLEP